MRIPCLSLATFLALAANRAAGSEFKKLEADPTVEYQQESGLDPAAPAIDPRKLPLDMFLSTVVTLNNTDNANAKRLVVCVNGYSKPGNNATDRVAFDIDIAGGKVQCIRSATAPKDDKPRLGAMGCQLVDLAKGQMGVKVTFVTGAVPNNDTSPPVDKRVRIQNGSTVGKRATGPFAGAHRVLPAAPRKTIDDKVFGRLDKALITFFVLPQATGMQQITKDAENDAENPKACNKCFGMNIFLRPGLPANLPNGVKYVTEWVQQRAVRATPSSAITIPINLYNDQTFANRFNAADLKECTLTVATVPNPLPNTWSFSTDQDGKAFTIPSEAPFHGTLTVNTPANIDANFLAQFIVTVKKKDGTFLFQNWIKMRNPAKCDANMTGKVDRFDIAEYMAALNTPADPADDADNDGKITVNDARACVQQCAKPFCAL